MKTYKYIIWDWNGTLLDDLQINFEIENTLLRNRGLKEMENIFVEEGIEVVTINVGMKDVRGCIACGG